MRGGLRGMRLGSSTAGPDAVPYGRVGAASGIAALVCALALCFAPPVSAASGDWPMFQQNPQHTGQAAAAGPASPTIAWTYAPKDGYEPRGTPPIVGPDGTVYVARTNSGSSEPLSCSNPFAEQSVIDAVSPQGNVIWQWTDPCSAVFRSGMAVASDGTVFAIDSETLYAIAPGGTTRWTMPIDSEGEVTIGPDGTLYVQDLGSTLYAVDPANGQVLWTYSPPNGTTEPRGTAAISPDGSTIYVGSSGGVLSALTTSGGFKWALNLPGSEGIENTPAVGPDGTIYVATFSGALDAVTPEGALKWTHSTGGGFETAPAIGNDGLIYAGNDAGQLVAVKAVDGSPAWTFQAPGASGANGFYNSSPLVDTNGTTLH